MRKITSEEAYREQVAGPGLTVAVFKTTWCKDCHFIDPFIGEVEAAYTDRLTMVEIDRDEMPELCEEMNILGIPSFIAFRDGREVVRFVSKLRKSREEIEQFLDRAVAVSGALESR
ncbi:thioredoxin family protein [Cohnella boryungensis]|uniref:Thioredoxin family protein n=1 Tax=Cohnella boryungensis TaxID=768479 RepID=A0ABV8SAF5_9BACL